MAAGPGPHQARAHGRLGRQRRHLARRQHRAVLPRAGAVLPADPRHSLPAARPSATTTPCAASTARFPAACTAPTRTRAGLHRAAPGHRDLQLGRDDVQRRDADRHHRRSASGPTAARRSPSTRCPASMTPDLKGLHYLTAPNQIQLDRAEQVAPGPERRRHVLLQPLRVPLLPAQRGHAAGPTSPSTCGWPRRTTAWRPSFYAASEVERQGRRRHGGARSPRPRTTRSTRRSTSPSPRRSRCASR